MKTALSIAGSDCSGGAGIQADLKTFAAHQVFGTTCITSAVAENTARVIGYQDIDPDIIGKQIDAVFEDIPPDAVKVGMLSCPGTMEAVAKKITEWSPKNVVVDPVMYAKNGSALMDPGAIGVLTATIVPLADMLTPNIPEAEKIAGIQIRKKKDREEAARRIHSLGCRGVLIKGGHSDGDATDIFYDDSGFRYYSSPRIATENTHGTGCTYSSAIAANLALEIPTAEAVERAKNYITAAIKYSLSIGRGHGPTHHFHNFYRF